MAGAIAFQLALLEGLGHQIKGKSQPAQFVASMAQAGSSGEITHSKTGAGMNECLDRADNQQVAAGPADGDCEGGGGGEPAQIAGERTIGTGEEESFRDFKNGESFLRNELVLHRRVGVES